MRQLSFLVPEEDPAISPEACPNGFPAAERDRVTVLPVTDGSVTDGLASLPPVAGDLVVGDLVPGASEALETYRVEPIPDQGHPFLSGTLFSSPGGHFTYRVIGACCRLFDREELPWPCCRLQWRGKEPSWRRIGRRFVLDTASRHSPSYNVEILELGHYRETIVMTLYAVRLSNGLKSWWYEKPRP